MANSYPLICTDNENICKRTALKCIFAVFENDKNLTGKKKSEIGRIRASINLYTTHFFQNFLQKLDRAGEGNTKTFLGLLTHCSVGPKKNNVNEINTSQKVTPHT